jgi:hypothetical protein
VCVDSALDIGQPFVIVRARNQGNPWQVSAGEMQKALDRGIDSRKDSISVEMLPLHHVSRISAVPADSTEPEVLGTETLPVSSATVPESASIVITSASFDAFVMDAMKHYGLHTWQDLIPRYSRLKPVHDSTGEGRPCGLRAHCMQ